VFKPFHIKDPDLIRFLLLDVLLQEVFETHEQNSWTLFVLPLRGPLGVTGPTVRTTAPEDMQYKYKGFQYK